LEWEIMGVLPMHERDTFMSPTRRSVLQAGGTGVAAAVAGCLSEPGDSGSEASGRLSGYAAFFVLWDWIDAITGEEITVENVLSVGEAGHGWNPPGDLVLDVAESDFFVYLDTPEFSWAQDVAAQVEEEDVRTIDLMSAVGSDQLLPWTGGHDHEEGQDHDHEEGDDHEDEGGGSRGEEFSDPHVWLDPVLAGEMVDSLAEEVAALDPGNGDRYREKADSYVERLDEVDAAFRQLSERARVDVAVFAGHNSFQYVENRYGFRIHSPQGVTPDAEPSPDDIAGTIELVEDNDIDAILYNPLETSDVDPPPLARRILESTDATRALPLASGDGTTGEWQDDGWGWIEQMTEINIPSLRTALGAE
jgi:zinc transport system substrate-binding protein